MKLTIVLYRNQSSIYINAKRKPTCSKRTEDLLAAGDTDWVMQPISPNLKL